MKRVIAYRFSALGDVAMSVPVFKEILEQNEDLEIVMISREAFKDLFDAIPRLQFKGVNLGDHKGYIGMKKLAKEIIQEYPPDFIADLHNVIRSKILNCSFKSFRLPVYILDKGKKDKKNLINPRNTNKAYLKKSVERYADVFRSMGFKVSLSHQLKPLTTQKEGIGIAPFAQHKGKILPLEKTFELVKLIAKREKVYLFGGGKNEAEILQMWQQRIPNTESIVGKLNLKEELQLISKLKLMISMDSANMHFASLVGTRCISIWAQTHYYAGFLGYGQSENDVVHVKDLTCRPCSVFGDKKCYRGDWACLNEFEIQQVLNKIQPT